MQRNLHKEAYLWYTITSPDYLQDAQSLLRKAASFLRARAEAHEFIMRYAPVPHWLGVMEYLVETFPNAKAMLSHGEYSSAFDWVTRVKDIPRGLAESEMGWLSPADESELKNLVNSAYSICSEFETALTMSRYFSVETVVSGEVNWKEWYPEDHGFSGDTIQLIDELYPADAPEYAVDDSLYCETSKIVPWTGVWVPTTGMGTSALAFARQGQIMQPAYEITRTDEETGFKEMRPVTTRWHPVRPTGHQLTSVGHDIQGRVKAGQVCPRTGWWRTPAKADSRRHFKEGDAFPKIEGSDYGETFWLWSPDQSAPTL